MLLLPATLDFKTSFSGRRSLSAAALGANAA
jgi:hypothetical protein